MSHMNFAAACGCKFEVAVESATPSESQVHIEKVIERCPEHGYELEADDSVPVDTST